MKRLFVSVAVVVLFFLSFSAHEAKAWGWRWGGGWGSRYYSNYGWGCNRCYYPSYNYGYNGYGYNGYGYNNNYGMYSGYGGNYGNYGSYPNYGAMYGGYGYGNYGAGFPAANLLSVLGAGGGGLAGAQASYVSIPMGGGYGQPSYLQLPVGGAAGRPTYMQVPMSTGFGQSIYMQIQLGPTASNSSPAPSPAATPPVGYLPGNGKSMASTLARYPVLNVAPSRTSILRDRNSDGTGSPASASEGGPVTTLDGAGAKAPTRLIGYAVLKKEQAVSEGYSADGAWSPIGLPTYSQLHAKALARSKATQPSEPGLSLEVASSANDR